MTPKNHLTSNKLKGRLTKNKPRLGLGPDRPSPVSASGRWIGPLVTKEIVTFIHQSVQNESDLLPTFQNDKGQIEHKDQLETRGVTNVNQLHRIEFPAWFHTKDTGVCYAFVEFEDVQSVRNAIKEYFDVNPSRYSNDDYKLIVDGIEDIAARRYRQYKSDVNAYIRDKGTAVPYRGLTTEVWEKCIERSSSQKFKEKMVEEREEQTQQASSSSVAVNENDVVLKVLGERRGHRRAVGRVLRGTSRSHSSTTRLRDQHSTSESIQATNALKSKMETYMQQMNEFMTLLTSNLQSVMPGIQLPTPPPPPPLSPTHEEERIRMPGRLVTWDYNSGVLVVIGHKKKA
ncbi:Uncharacterized protein Fot_21679 [Forsythia ovata]|uniref:Uncharacterized protein n=1 Tax=Forsythia ovata TaxID=205694 RepID=A0ABD1UVJ2_9LAMI